MIGELDGTDFAYLYRQRSDEIIRLSHTQRVIGMEPGDVASELTECLWKAFSTFRPTDGLTLGQYWWSIWMNRKADLITAYFAKKRLHAMPMSPQDIADLGEALAPLVTVGDLCPTADPTERVVWWMLSTGVTGLEVRELLRISWRTFYRILDGWRTDEVRSLLTYT